MKWVIIEFVDAVEDKSVKWKLHQSVQRFLLNMKGKAKSLRDIMNMHQEAEKLIGQSRRWGKFANGR
jgi:hypothetical protein